MSKSSNGLCRSTAPGFTLSGPCSSPVGGKRRNFGNFQHLEEKDKALQEEGKMGAFYSEILQERKGRKSHIRQYIATSVGISCNPTKI